MQASKPTLNVRLPYLPELSEDSPLKVDFLQIGMFCLQGWVCCFIYFLLYL